MAGNLQEFVKAGDFVKYMKAKQVMKKLPVYSFDEVEEPDGKVIKRFVRIKGDYITKMYTDIMHSPSHNYITCVDNLLHNEKIDREEFENTKVSAILKTPPTDAYNVICKMNEAERATMAELVCSRVANLLNVKTEYVAPIKDNPYGCIIVDFLQDKEQVESFSDFTKTVPSSYLKEFDISNWISPLVNEVFFRTPGALENPQIVGEKIYPIVEDFARQFLFKKYIIHDADLCAVNVGIITTPDGNSSVAPAYDYEQCLMPGIRTLQGEGMEKDIMYLARIYPQILKNIAKDFTLDDSRKNKLKDILDTFCTKDDLREEYYNLMVDSCLNFSILAKESLAPQDEIEIN